jgi:hypothetical protein
MTLTEAIRLVWEIPTLPRIDVRMWGDSVARELFSYFVRPHPRLRLVESKRLGAAMVPLPDTFEEYLQGGQMQALRTNRDHAIDFGYHVGVFLFAECFEQALEINLSMGKRGGRPMAAHYTNRSLFAETMRPDARIFGLLDKGGALAAYAYAPICGEVAVLHYLLGHADHLARGVMYLLVSEVIREVIALKRQGGMPGWLMYDTFYGASAGLQYFKRRLGFSPYIVRWKWDDNPDASMIPSCPVADGTMLAAPPSSERSGTLGTLGNPPTSFDDVEVR